MCKVSIQQRVEGEYVLTDQLDMIHQIQGPLQDIFDYQVPIHRHDERN